MAIQRSLPADARRSLRIYNLLFPLVFLAMLPGFIARMLKRGGFREKFGQRLGRYSSTDLARFRSREWLWIHSISVGETFIALKLARALHALDPEIGIVISTTTSTGFAEARKAACDWIEPIYNPIDARSIVRRALDALQPRQIILIEGEAWPNLLAEAFRLEIPVSLVNARLSPRSERRFRRFRGWTGPVFRLLERVCVPDVADIARWENLGVERSRIDCTGSIKFDQANAPLTRETEFRALLASLGVTERTPVIVGGSTWEPEELVLTRLLPALRDRHPGAFLILVPRHIERTADILRQLAPLGLKVVRRSQLPQPQPTDADILLVDATGELREWFAFATVVFIGKSLPGIAQVGGQNPAEPALLGKPVVFGPHMENFDVLVAQLLSGNGAVQFAQTDELEGVLSCLLDAAPRRQALAEGAQTVLAKHIGATAATARKLLSQKVADVLRTT